MPKKIKSKSRKTPKRNSNKNKKNNSKKVKCNPGTSLINVNGKKMCVGRCPHSGGIIKYDPVTKDLKCQLHGSRFDSKTGKIKLGTGPAVSHLKIF